LLGKASSLRFVYALIDTPELGRTTLFRRSSFIMTGKSELVPMLGVGMMSSTRPVVHRQTPTSPVSRSRYRYSHDDFERFE
jgi:hypothetical protein